MAEIKLNKLGLREQDFGFYKFRHRKIQKTIKRTRPTRTGHLENYIGATLGDIQNPEHDILQQKMPLPFQTRVQTLKERLVTGFMVIFGQQSLEILLFNVWLEQILDDL